MKDRIEGVKKIRDIISDARLTAYQDGKAGVIAFRIGNMEYEKQICQLFEPKPDESRLLDDTEMSDEEIGKELIKILGKWFQGSISADMHFDYSPEAEVVNFLKPIFVKAGIREVVEWLVKEDEHVPSDIPKLTVDWHRWQAKLKEWGIELPNARI